MPFTRAFALLTALFFLSPHLAFGEEATPSPYVQRGELATALILARNPNVPKVKNTGQYPDVSRGDALEPYLLAAGQYGILSPDRSGKLRPAASVSRAEFLKMLTQTFGLPNNYPYSFIDVPKSAWYEPYAGLAQKYNLFEREDISKLNPERLVMRTEALEGLRTFLRLRDETENTAKAQQLAEEQAREKLTIYSVISTRRTRVVFVQKKQPTKVTTPAPTPISLPQLRTEVVKLVNTIRLGKSLKPLHYNQLLENSAQTYADAMAEQGFFGHVSPEGQTLKDRIGETGYYDREFSGECNCVKGFSLGENLARGQKTPDEVVEAWMKSPSHRAAILNADYTDIGIGVKSAVWVQHFGGILLPGQKILEEQ